MEQHFGNKFGDLLFTPPILSLSAYDLGDTKLSSCYLTAVMCFPGQDDDKLRRKATAVLYGHMATTAANEPDILPHLYKIMDIDFIEALVTPPSLDTVELYNKIYESQKIGWIVGTIFENIYTMKYANIKLPSINKGKFLVQLDIKELGLNVCCSEDTLGRYWEKFKPVSHLWAALECVILEKYGEPAPGQDYLPIAEIIDEEIVVSVISIAEHFRHFGEEFVTHNTNINAQRALFAKNEVWRPTTDFPILCFDWDKWANEKYCSNLKEKLTCYKSSKNIKK